MIQLVTQVRPGQSASIYQVMNKKDRHSNPINCKGIAGAFQLGEGYGAPTCQDHFKETFPLAFAS
jgi:hypothetical protein